MATRTSKKQMHELGKLFRDTFGANNMVYAAGEYNATHKAYIKHNGVVTEYANNTDAFEAALEIMAEHEADEPDTNDASKYEEALDWAVAQWQEDKAAKNEAARLVGSLLWHIDTMCDYDCDGEVYDALVKIADVLGR